MVKLRVTKKQILVGVGVVLLIGAAVGAGFLVRWLQNKDGNAAEQTTIKPLPDTVTKTEELITSGKTDEANKKIEEAVNNQATTSKEKYLLYIQQGNMAVEAKNYNGGLDAFLKAEGVDPTSEIAGKIGSLYQLMGNNPKAIEYYKKAITRSSESDPMHEREVEIYTEMIRNLGGQP